MHTGKTWAIVLADDSWPEAAGGERHTDGATVSLRSVIGQLRGIVSRSRIYAIVDAAQPEYWRADVWALPASAVICRPAHQAAGACVLLALLAIERADPHAQVLIVPVGIPEMLLAALLAASANTLELARRRNCVVLIGDRQQGSADALGHCDIDLGLSIVAASVATLIGSYETLRPRSLTQLRQVLAPVRRGGASPVPVGSLAPLLDSVAPESAEDEMLVCCADRLHVLDVSRDLTGHWDVPLVTGAAEADRSPLQMIH